jgi:hypothetical protein
LSLAHDRGHAIGELLGVRRFGSTRYLMYIPEIARAITSCWISAVPSKMS